MAGTGRLRSGAGAGKSQDMVAQDSQKLDVVLAAVERIGDSLERARTSLEAKIDRVTSDLVLLHADHHKLADKTGEIELGVDELVPTTSRLKSEMEETAWEWLESSGLDTSGAAERPASLPRGRRGRTRRARRKGEIWASRVTRAPDLEQSIQERREAIQSAAAISTSPLVSESNCHSQQVTDLLPQTACRS
ncbi:hypothetical protein NDU88_002987 [Pleurodeles waltl]|uniref:Uncharacterized protein n=1 Tax=Pleurodeles waltl TaxID=8319 RepID=A0AAV7KVR0_PLEWA|nr:hypothetical protein NDU88_002987 [Pleurodeles waltl]